MSYAKYFVFNSWGNRRTQEPQFRNIQNIKFSSVILITLLPHNKTVLDGLLLCKLLWISIEGDIPRGLTSDAFGVIVMTRPQSSAELATAFKATIKLGAYQEGVPCLKGTNLRQNERSNRSYFATTNCPTDSQKITN